MVMSAISKSRMHLTSLAGRAAVGLNVPGAEIIGGCFRGGMPPVDTVDVAAASRSGPGEKMGSGGSADVIVVTELEEGPVWRSGWVLGGGEM